LTKNQIRLQYSGFIVFAAKMLSVATGLAFVLMITRNVSDVEFGIWGNIRDLLIYFTLIAGIIPFWTTRFVARQHKGSAKTGLVANVLISIIATTLYLTLLPIMTSVLQISPQHTIFYIIISLQIIESYTITALQAILYAERPETLGYGLLLHEVVKVAIGYLLIMTLNMGLLGAIISIITAYSIQITYYLKLTAGKLKEKIQWSHLKEWLKASPINVYNVVGTQMATFALILLFSYGIKNAGKIARANYGAASTITMVISYSAFLAYALYPKLLAKAKAEDVSTSLKMVLMFAIPMTVGAIIFAGPYLTILSYVYDYTEAKMVLILLAIDVFFISLSQVFNNVVMGVEKIDEKAKIPFKQLMKSRLFQIFSISYLRAAIVLPTTFFALTTIAKTPVEAAENVALTFLIADFTVLICIYIIARKSLQFSFPWKSIAKYILASAVMAALLFIVPDPKRLSSTLTYTVLGGATYLTVLTIIDKDARTLAVSSWLEAKKDISKVFQKSDRM